MDMWNIFLGNLKHSICRVMVTHREVQQLISETYSFKENRCTTSTRTKKTSVLPPLYANAFTKSLYICYITSEKIKSQGNITQERIKWWDYSLGGIHTLRLMEQDYFVFILLNHRVFKWILLITLWHRPPLIPQTVQHTSKMFCVALRDALLHCDEHTHPTHTEQSVRSNPDRHNPAAVNAQHISDSK